MQLTERTEVNPPTADERLDQAREIVREAAQTSPEDWQRFYDASDDPEPRRLGRGDRIGVKDLLDFAERQSPGRIDKDALKELKAELAPKPKAEPQQDGEAKQGRLEGLRGVVGDPPSAPPPLSDIDADRASARLRQGLKNLSGFESQLAAEVAQWQRLRSVDPVSASRIAPSLDNKLHQYRQLVDYMYREGRQMEAAAQRSSAHAVFGYSNPSQAELEPLIRFGYSLGLNPNQLREISLKPRWARAFAAAYRSVTGQETRRVQAKGGQKSRVPSHGAIQDALMRLETKHAKRKRANRSDR